MDELSEERIARNDAAFRSANERLQAAATSWPDDRLPFICECADRGCTEVVFLTGAAYDTVRRNPRRFFNVPGHERADRGVGEVVERHDNYLVYEKHGLAGEVAERLDERLPTGAARAKESSG